MIDEEFYAYKPSSTLKKRVVKPTTSLEEKRLALIGKLRISVDYIMDMSGNGDYYLMTNIDTPMGMMYFTSNAFRRYPLQLLSLTPVTNTELAADMVKLVTTVPLPDKLDRKNLPDSILLENADYRFNLRLAKVSMLKWLAERIRESGQSMHWLPIIQDLIWMEWGWKKNTSTKKKKKAAVRTTPVSRRAGRAMPSPFDGVPQDEDVLREVIQQRRAGILGADAARIQWNVARAPGVVQAIPPQDVPVWMAAADAALEEALREELEEQQEEDEND